MTTAEGYIRFIEDHFKIVDKDKRTVPMKLNRIQKKFVTEDMSGADIVLKARQQGFSSIITAVFTVDFILVPNSYNVILADIEDNAVGLLLKVKKYIESYEQHTGVRIPMAYESKFELVNEFMGSTFKIGTAVNANFGRSKTISNLHCSEVAFYPNIEDILSGAAQAVPAGGRKIYETTANGFNQFKSFYEDAENGLNGHKALFYPASAFYPAEFLAMKKTELKRKFPQEYPENPVEAFLTSGACYFDLERLKGMYAGIKQPEETGLVYPRNQSIGGETQ